MAVGDDVRVTLLRRHGRRLKNNVAEAEQQYVGCIVDHWQQATQVVTMGTGRQADALKKLPPVL